ncbi:YdcF family protein [Microbacterium invictum]|nr:MULTISPECIES: YdcF family protein [Microbacterium]
MLRRGLVVSAALGAGVLLGGEWEHWRASRRLLGAHPGAGDRRAIVVLGYGNRGARANWVNRYRVRAALRALTATADDVLVMCGGSVEGPVPEADILARHARELGYAGPMLLDRESRTTEENIRNAIPLIEDADRIVIASGAVHAEKARAHLWQQRPDLAERLVRGHEYRFGEVTLMKPIEAVIGRRRMHRAAARNAPTG